MNGVRGVQLPPSLLSALQRLPEPVQEAFVGHIVGGTSADYLAEWLRRAGTPVSATTIKRYRADMRTNDG